MWSALSRAAPETEAVDAVSDPVTPELYLAAMEEAEVMWVWVEEAATEWVSQSATPPPPPTTEPPSSPPPNVSRSSWNFVIKMNEKNHVRISISKHRDLYHENVYLSVDHSSAFLT